MAMTSIPALSLVVVNAKGEQSHHDLLVVTCLGNFEASVLGDAKQTIDLSASYGRPGEKVEARISLSVENDILRRVLASNASYELVIKSKEAQ